MPELKESFRTLSCYWMNVFSSFYMYHVLMWIFLFLFSHALDLFFSLGYRVHLSFQMLSLVTIDLLHHSYPPAAIFMLSIGLDSFILSLCLMRFPPHLLNEKISVSNLC